MARSSAVTSDSSSGKGRKPRESRRGSLAFWALGVATGALLGVALPTGLLLALGLAPSAVAMVADNSRGRWTARAVLVFNLAGLAPALRSLWLEGHTLGALARVAFRFDGLPLAYAAAAFGAALPMVASWAVLAVLEARAAMQVARLEQRRAALRENWGDSVDEPATGESQPQARSEHRHAQVVASNPASRRMAARGG